jgi:hypothetical protein
VSTRTLQRVGTAALAALTVVGLMSGCAAKKKTASASTAPVSSSASASASAAAALPSDTPSKVVATGGGKFCQQVASEVNSNVAKEAATGTGVDSIKTSVQDFKSLEGSVLKSAPGAIRPDLVTLFGALDQFYAALAAANYDFTKINPSVEAPLEAPAVQAAEQRVESYLKTTCGIDTGSDAESANTGAVEASASAALASALAKLTASAAPAS